VILLMSRNLQFYRISPAFFRQFGGNFIAD